MSDRPCFPPSRDGHNCTLREGHDGPHLCCDGHEWSAVGMTRRDFAAHIDGDCDRAVCDYCVIEDRGEDE